MTGGRRRLGAAAVGLAALAMLLGLGLSACVLDVPYDKYAIVYGVADYEGTTNDLAYPDDDAIAMRDMLSGQGYQVIPWTRTDSAATRANLLADIAAVAALAGEEDLFVFYFSGHGGQPGGTGPEPSAADSFTEWIYLYGSLGLPAQTFNDDQLLAAFADIKARRKVIILDSCNSGGFIGNSLEADGEPPALTWGNEGLLDLASRAIRLYSNFDGSSADIPPSQALVLSASGERESSYEFGLPFNHGIFTYYLLQAETEGDLDHDGLVTVTEAFAYTQDMIYRYWNYGYGYPADVFSPHVSGGPVDYVLLEAR